MRPLSLSEPWRLVVEAGRPDWWDRTAMIVVHVGRGGVLLDSGSHLHLVGDAERGLVPDGAVLPHPMDFAVVRSAALIAQRTERRLCLDAWCDLSPEVVERQSLRLLETAPAPTAAGVSALSQALGGLDGLDPHRSNHTAGGLDWLDPRRSDQALGGLDGLDPHRSDQALGGVGGLDLHRSGHAAGGLDGLDPHRSNHPRGVSTGSTHTGRTTPGGSRLARPTPVTTGGLRPEPIRSLGPILATAALSRDRWTQQAALFALIGAGPGATPTGDDVVVGILAGFHALAATDPTSADAARAITADLRCLLPRTTRASGQELAAAADGRFSTRVLRLVAATADPDTARQVALAAARWGATSGHDLASGLISALCAARFTDLAAFTLLPERRSA